jgi:DNA-binding NtrC family response regulator
MKLKHILLADDEKHTRFGLSLVLKRAGFRVTAVSDGIEAFSRIIEMLDMGDTIDLLVVDVQMPALTGMELVSELEKQHKCLPVLMITGYENREMLERLMHKKCVMCLEKPFEPERLLKHVELAIEKCSHHADGRD